MYSRTDYRHHVLQDRFQAHFIPGQLPGSLYSRRLRPRLQQSVPWLNWPDRIHHVSSLLCTVLYCIALYCIALYCIALYCIALYFIVLHCTVFYCTARHSHVYSHVYSAITYNIVGCSILQYCITPHVHYEESVPAGDTMAALGRISPHIHIQP